jgi:hypothetical protein
MFKRTILLAVAFFGLALFVGPLEAAIYSSGDVDPADLSLCDSQTYIYISAKPESVLGRVGLGRDYRRDDGRGLLA